MIIQLNDIPNKTYLVLEKINAIGERYYTSTGLYRIILYLDCGRFELDFSSKEEAEQDIQLIIDKLEGLK